MIYTIIRDKWLRGEGITASCLLRESDGKMCCLGQVLEQCGAGRGALARARGPSSTSEMAILAKPIGLVMESDAYGSGFKSSPSAYSMMVVNDNEELGDEEREHMLKIEASKLGHTLIFV